MKLKVAQFVKWRYKPLLRKVFDQIRSAGKVKSTKVGGNRQIKAKDLRADGNRPTKGPRADGNRPIK